MSELKLRVEGMDVVGISESWANRNIYDAELNINGFNMFRIDRQENKGGGVILYVAKRLQATVNGSLMKITFQEAIWVNIALKDISLSIGVCYRSPTST